MHSRFKGVKKNLDISFLVLIITVLSISTATYAWLEISKTPSVTDLDFNIIVENSLLLAEDTNGVEGEYTNILNLDNKSISELNITPVTFNQEKSVFEIPQYTTEGRIESLGGDLSFMEIEADKNEAVLRYDFWARSTASDCGVMLTLPVLRQEETNVEGYGTYLIGKPVWNESLGYHEDMGNGAESAVRIAFYVHENNGDEDSFIIYEPNSIEGEESAVIADVVQNMSTWTEKSPITQDEQDVTVGEFVTEENIIFSLSRGEPKLISMFIWLEGTDSQCTNSISGANLKLNLQFKAVVDEQEILQPLG